MSDKKKLHKPLHNHDGPDHSSPYPLSRLAPPTPLVDLAREIEKADQMIATQINSKLQVISDQIRKLQDQAREVLEKARNDQELHRVRCSFKRIPGHIYHLYVKEGDFRYFSMLSPADWHGVPPDTYIGPFRLEADMSWTSVEGKQDRDAFNEMVNGFMRDENGQ